MQILIQIFTNILNICKKKIRSRNQKIQGCIKDTGPYKKIRGRIKKCLKVDPKSRVYRL